jgi:hypothetical protein
MFPLSTRPTLSPRSTSPSRPSRSESTTSDRIQEKRIRSWNRWKSSTLEVFLRKTSISLSPSKASNS